MKHRILEWGRAIGIWLASGGLYIWLGGQSLQFLWWVCSVMIVNGLLISMFGPSRIEIKRTITPSCLYTGEDAGMTVTIQFKSWMPLPWIMLTDKIGGHTIRKLWFPGFRRSVSCSYTFQPSKRGNWTSMDSEVEWGDMFGWFRSSRTVLSPAGLVVLPRPLSLRGWGDLTLGTEGEAEEVPKAIHSALPGQGLRDYITGDPLNRIHWRNSAKIGRLQTILPQPGRSIDRCIILDTSEAGYAPLNGSSAAFDPTFEVAVSAAAGLLYSSVITYGATSLWIGGIGKASVRSARTERQDEQDILLPLAYVPYEPGGDTAAGILQGAADDEGKETELILVTGQIHYTLIEAAIRITALGRRVSIYCVCPPAQTVMALQSSQLNERSEEPVQPGYVEGGLGDRFLEAGGRLLYIFEENIYEITMSRGGGEDGEFQQLIR
ncbi:DUF58 domain-containing protein [Paenibacillus dakarensis]|uniref:DUF58 domain-containing protein n=1 Tax=Paenibacillus dakarensis TaxID=1527293 RepID=UPI0006D58CB4|nr:DUF58 domain-containing protein [Paenibacillus dakarensis]